MEDEIMTITENNEVEAIEPEETEYSESGSNAGVVALVVTGVIAAGIAAFHFGKKKLAELKAKKETTKGDNSVEFKVE